MTKETIAAIEESFINATNQGIEWLLNPTYYYQLLAILVVALLVYLVGKVIRARIPILSEPGKGVERFSSGWFIRRSGRLLYPLLTMMSLVATAALCKEHLENQIVIEAVQRVVVVWFLWVALKAFVTNALVRTVALWFLVPAALLQLFGLFEPTVSALDSYSFEAGEVRISAYTVLKAIFYVSLLVWLGKLTSHTGSGYIRKKDALNRSTKELLVKLFDIVLFSSLFLITLNLIGIDLTALAVFSGALGVGLGFGLQKVASNFISGIILLSEKSINLGNLIEMNDGIFGYVRKLGARAAVVETFDGREVMVPNEDFITSRVSNYTYSNTYGRVDIEIGVDYDADLELAYKVITEAAYEYEHALDDCEEHKTECYLREFGDSSVNFHLIFWLRDVSGGRWRAKSDVMFAIWRKLKEHDITIPFPQRDLHIRSGLDVLQAETTQKTKKANATKK